MRYLKGATLIEVLLVIMMGGALILLGLQTYRQLKFEQQINQTKYNIDTLFQGAKDYYHANCRSNLAYSTNTPLDPSVGLLDPRVTTPPALISGLGTRAINITQDLVTPGYLAFWPAQNMPPFVTDYRVQFNLYKNASTTQPARNIYFWTIQVAVKIKDLAKVKYYQGRLNANCASRLSGNAVMPCRQATPSAKNDYLVLERLPSAALSAANTSPLWLSMPKQKSEVQQYTNDDAYTINNNDASYNDSTGYQNYLCDS